MFTHLHIQSAYSLLSSTVKIDELVSQAKANGFSSLALTDRNVMYGSVYFYKECLKQGIKPIIGLIADVLDNQDNPYPLILLAKNNKGYQNLLKISSAIQTKSRTGLPVKWLKAYSEGLICISPGADGRIETYLSEGLFEQAQETALFYQSIFGKESFYLSMQRLEKEPAELVEHLSEVTGIPGVATNPVFYLNKEDALAKDVLTAVKNGEKLTDEKQIEPVSGEHYLKSGKEMAEAFRELPEMLANTLKIAAQCEVVIPFNQSLLPKYPVENNMTADEMLVEVCMEGLKKRYQNPSEAYEERLHYELSIINKMKFSDYFLIVWDFMKFARQNQILTGPGRGSAAGSMVAYVLQITDVDPIEHNLLFERFLNPERISMPDIDIDFPDNRREEVISYVASKYGELHVAQIITFGTFAAKAAIRDTGRVFGLTPSVQERLSKMIPTKLGTTLKDAYKESKPFRDFMNESETNKLLYEIALKIEGLPRHTSTHAAGVVISDMPLTDIIAIQEGHEGIHLTQFPMDLLEELGLLKMDFLGLRNLTLLDNMLTAIQKGTGQKIDITGIPYDDEKTFKLLSKGDTTGIFQLESEGIRKVIMKLTPTRFEDIVAVNALYRPGPMENIPLFIERKHGIKPIDYVHPELQPILEDTYGVIVYQEQIMQIASKMAGFTLGEADLLRRAVSKKKKEILDEERAHFVEGAVKQGYETEIAHVVYDSIVRFANYGFNRSHAVAYSFIAYQLAYLKAHFPKPFMAALMTSVIGNEDKISQYVREAKNKEIPVLPPSINKSVYSFHVESEGIRFSLGAIKGVGGAVLREIFQARRQKKFEDFFDFCLRVSGKIVNRKILEVLIHSGAFDDFGEDRATLVASIDVALSHAELVKPDGNNQFDLFESNEFSLKPKYMKVKPMDMENKLSQEKSVLGLYLSNHPVTSYLSIFQHFGTVSIDQALLTSEKKVLLGVYITAFKSIRTKKGEVMAFMTISDESGDLEAVVFPNVYKNQISLFQKGMILMLKGTLEEREGKKQLIVQEAFPPDDLKRMMEEESSRLFIKIEKEKQTAASLQKIKQVLSQHNGTTKVMLYYESEDRYVQLSMWDWITPSAALLQKLKKIAGEENVVLKEE
ncbi:DNA polymerase III subunit alpha [Bacillus sp. CECT 9360]|uniref:DNA polymerase III subunit alpha n=1 Tax=Bacillus sp. CECT 9360 TaxID=2845821 RepID=UPI001E297F53|nr:DNA polymerase III subunit alpha [Bacillus sp. CECT 9360]CAH0346224.1 DNA polymerase III subunit alpha [Bacillus sp. CECT 9360]